jgi:hypothetical protein
MALSALPRAGARRGEDVRPGPRPARPHPLTGAPATAGRRRSPASTGAPALRTGVATVDRRARHVGAARSPPLTGVAATVDRRARLSRPCPGRHGARGLAKSPVNACSRPDWGRDPDMDGQGPDPATPCGCTGTSPRRSCALARAYARRCDDCAPDRPRRRSDAPRRAIPEALDRAGRHRGQGCGLEPGHDADSVAARRPAAVGPRGASRAAGRGGRQLRVSRPPRRLLARPPP